MLTTSLIVLMAALALLFLVPRVQAKWARRRQPVYICDICSARDCQCRRER